MSKQFAMDVAKKVFLSVATAAAGYKTKQLLTQWDMAKAGRHRGTSQSGARGRVSDNSYCIPQCKPIKVAYRGRVPKRNQKGVQKKT